MLAHRWAKPPPALHRSKSLLNCNVEVWNALHPRLFLERMVTIESAITELQKPANDCATFSHSIDISSIYTASRDGERAAEGKI